MALIRIFVACADERERLALLLFIDHQPGMVVVGMADRFSGLAAQIEGSQPDVLLIDSELDGHSIKELLGGVQNLQNQPKIVVLSSNPQNESIALEAGADAFACKDSPPDDLLAKLNKFVSTQANRYSPMA